MKVDSEMYPMIDENRDAWSYEDGGGSKDLSLSGQFLKP